MADNGPVAPAPGISGPRRDRPVACDAAAGGARKTTVRAPHRSIDTLRVCVLGSGSGGNCTVVCSGDRALLIDAGFGPRTTRRRLAHAQTTLEQVHAVCLTHLDQDHFRQTWPPVLLTLGVRLFVHRWHAAVLGRLPGAGALEAAGLVETFDADPFEPMPGVAASTIRLQHDLQGTIGYRMDAARGSIGYATDLGHAPRRLVDHLAGVDLLCLECNYDEHMAIHSPRPAWVNRRNLSDSGHLSNEQAFEAVQHITAASPRGIPRHVLLMHRSSQCNHPTKVQRVFERDPSLARRITLTQQRRRTRWFTVKPLPCLKRRQLGFGF